MDQVLNLEDERPCDFVVFARTIFGSIYGKGSECRLLQYVSFIQSKLTSATNKNAGNVKRAILYTEVGNTLAPASMAPCHPMSKIFPVRGSDNAPNNASNAFMNPTAVAAKIGGLISLIMAKQSRKVLMKNPNPNIHTVRRFIGRGGHMITKLQRIRAAPVPITITIFLWPI